jgi:hypothetical protein
MRWSWPVRCKLRHVRMGFFVKITDLGQKDHCRCHELQHPKFQTLQHPPVRLPLLHFSCPTWRKCIYYMARRQRQSKRASIVIAGRM